MIIFLPSICQLNVKTINDLFKNNYKCDKDTKK